ncbi:hypothetical protein [Streptomyces sp. NPDC056361]|uniref:hypothetical protein n=1 Tax=Streptomyces sp. NPDC056361 TaxID=3345795 RepID=UPI0035D99203
MDENRRLTPSAWWAVTLRRGGAVGRLRIGVVARRCGGASASGPVAEPGLVAGRPGQTLIGDKNYFGRDFEHLSAEQGVRLLRPARKGEPERPGAPMFKPLRQVIASVNETFKGQVDLEQHRGRTPDGVIARVIRNRAVCHRITAGRALTRRSLLSGAGCDGGGGRRW